MNVNLLNDFLFGKLFGERGCEKETLHLINPFTNKNFKSLSFELNEIKGNYKNNKKSVTDVLVMMNNDTLVNIEAQIGKQAKFHKRNHFYNSKIYSILLNVGEDYEELPMTIMINILGFNLHNLENYHTTFVLSEKINKEYTLEDIIETHYIDLARFRIKVRKNKIDLNDPKDRLTLLLDEKTPQSLIDQVIKMDEFANNIYKKNTSCFKR
ncbi:hypothetical protein ALNOE001_20880 [Candidatus Methanobinarius endosymbioticus]|uniref:Transposase (putative) YhgA-like domain-containing protein n=1 Tax=Candidatus Methanobinarius endosymbioticus TaxID=2006182 RepID=A0A366M839_9EURY|nr:hypothetical protein ALNOE001_20880 [Candidatus Methanobinarius endosymbioticus]